MITTYFFAGISAFLWRFESAQCNPWARSRPHCHRLLTETPVSAFGLSSQTPDWPCVPCDVLLLPIFHTNV